MASLRRAGSRSALRRLESMRARARRWDEQQQLLREAQFKVLKYQFLKQHDLPRNQKKLFCDYLRRELEKHVEELVDIRPSSWVAFSLMPLAFFLLDGSCWETTDDGRCERWPAVGSYPFSNSEVVVFLALPWLLALLTFLLAWRANTMYHERLHHVYDEHFESFFRST